MTVRWLTRGLLLLLAAFDLIGAQTVRRIEVRDQPSCARCTIELRKIATLGARGDSVSPDVMATVAVDSRGNFYVGPVDTPGAVLIYDSTGRVVGSIGSAGQGPGEHVTVGIVKVGAGDTVYVFDAALWRLSVYGPSTRRLVRTVQLPRRTLMRDFIPLPSGDVLVNMQLGTPAAVGFPVHLVSPRGEIVRSFGDAAPVLEPDGAMDLRVVAASGGSAVWVGRENRYELERWRLDGVPDVTLARMATWFRPYAAGARRPDVQIEPPRPALRGLLQASDSVVWTRLEVPAAKWKPTWSAARGRSPPITSLDQYLSHFDSVLEAINPKTGQVIASKRVDPVLMRLFGPNLTFTHREDDEGFRYVDVWQFRLVAQNGATW